MISTSDESVRLRQNHRVCEGVSRREQEIIEIAAILHDLACRCAEKNTEIPTENTRRRRGLFWRGSFWRTVACREDMAERIVYLVGHHHTLTDVDGMDYQILIEADYLVNADESHYSQENIRHTMETVFRTATGISLFAVCISGLFNPVENLVEYPKYAMKQQERG